VLVPSDKLDENTAAAIAAVSQSSTGALRIRMHNKLRALVALGKYLGMFDERVTSGTPEVLAAKQAPSVIPIVFATAGDPVGNGLVASLARPGGNVTGLSLQSNDMLASGSSLLSIDATRDQATAGDKEAVRVNRGQTSLPSRQSSRGRYVYSFTAFGGSGWQGDDAGGWCQ
jgi:hypothetical protein